MSAVRHLSEPTSACSQRAVVRGALVGVCLLLTFSCNEKEQPDDTSPDSADTQGETGDWSGYDCGPVSRLESIWGYGWPPTAVFSPETDAQGAYEQVVLAGDLLGGGEGVLGVGAPEASAGGTAAGAVTLWLGPLGPVWYTEASATLVVHGEAESGLGSALDGGQDLDEDGLPDLAMGGSASDSVFVLLSGSLDAEAGESAPHAHIQGTGSSGLGARLDLAPDIDGDGVAELVFPAPDGGPSGEGAVIAVFGPISPGEGVVEDLGAFWTDSGGLRPTVVVGVDDVTGDGFGDLAVGAPAETASEEGATWVLPGGVGVELGGDLSEVATQIDDLDSYREQSLAPAGDLNGDGVGDLFVGTTDEDWSTFTVFPIYGGGDFDHAFIWAQVNEEAGRSQALSSGDLDGDGLLDFLIGGALMDLSEDEQDIGIATVAYLELDATAPSGASITFTEIGSRLGTSVDASSDISGDAIADVAFSAPGVGAGRVYVLSGCW